MKKENNYFHINYPFWSAWQKYGWKKDIWGIGLEKSRIDKLADINQEVIVSYYKSENEYVIKAKKVQKFPVERVKDYNVWVYIVPKDAMKAKPKEKLLSQLSPQEMFSKGYLS